MTAFLLPCECSAEIAVTAGQAGGSVACPRCGRTLRVPKLRDLGHLRRQDAEDTAPGAPWRPAHAVALLGAIVAAASWLGGLWIARDSAVAVDEALLRSAVLSADDLTVYKVWTEGLSKAGVRRPPADQEQAMLRRAQFVDGMRRMLNLLTTGALVAAAGAAFVLWSASRSSPGHDASAGTGRAQP